MNSILAPLPHRKYIINISNFLLEMSLSIIYTVTWMARALLGSGPIGTPRCAHATVEQWGYATHF
jgi:hypothetical protein